MTAFLFQALICSFYFLLGDNMVVKVFIKKKVIEA